MWVATPHLRRDCSGDHEAAWLALDMKFTRIIWINLENVGSSCLVPGGRWLLVGGEDGTMKTYDPDSPTMTRRPLITQDDQDEPDPIHHIAIDTDSLERPTFTMALQAKKYSKLCQYSRLSITDLHQELLLSTLTSGGSLSQHQSPVNGASPMLDWGPWFRIHSRRRNLFARIRILYHRSYIETYDWEKSRSSPHCNAVIILDVVTVRFSIAASLYITDVQIFRILSGSFQVIGSWDFPANKWWYITPRRRGHWWDG